MEHEPIIGAARNLAVKYQRAHPGERWHLGLPSDGRLVATERKSLKRILAKSKKNGAEILYRSDQCADSACTEAGVA